MTSPSVPVISGAVYVAKVGIKLQNIATHSEGGVKAAVRWYTASNHFVKEDVLVKRLTGSSVWIICNSTVMAPPNAAKAYIRLMCNNANGTAWFDDAGMFGQGVLFSSDAVRGAVPFAAGDGMIDENAILWDEPQDEDISPAAAPGAEESFRLGEDFAFPNPAVRRNSINLHIETGIADQVNIRFFNDAGEKVHEAVLTGIPPIIGGKYAYEYSWDLAGVPSGTYIYVAETKRAGQGTLRTKGKLAVIK
jgi:hypothetical protein